MNVQEVPAGSVDIGSDLQKSPPHEEVSVTHHLNTIMILLVSIHVVVCKVVHYEAPPSQILRIVGGCGLGGGYD